MRWLWLCTVCAVFVAAQDAARPVVDSDWEYSEQFERSPSRWQYILNNSALQWPICASGRAQAPAMLIGVTVDESLLPITNTWVTSNNYTIMNDGVRLRLVPQDVLPSFVDPNTGAVSTLTYAAIFNPGGFISGGNAADVEIAFVHGGSAPNTPYLSAPTVIVTVQFVAGYGHNERLQTMINSIPTPPLRDGTTGLTSSPNVAIVRTVFSVDQLLPPLDRSYVLLQGSELNPPCREGVKHYVLTTPMQISMGQLAILRNKLFVGQATGFTPRVARASRTAVPPTSSTTPKTRYVAGRQYIRISTPPTTEPLTNDTILALSAVIIAAVVLAIALVAALIAVCYTRTEESS